MLNAKWFFNLIIVTGLAAASHTAPAETRYYFGGNFALLDSSEDVAGEVSLDLRGLYARAGAQFHENFSSEIRLGVGIGDDTDNIANVEVEGELDHFYGGYFRGGVQAGNLFYPYLIAGYTRGKLDLEITASNGTRVKADETESDFSYGIGVDIRLSETVSGNVEYMNYYDKDDVELDGFALGIVRVF